MGGGGGEKERQLETAIFSGMKFKKKKNSRGLEFPSQTLVNETKWPTMITKTFLSVPTNNSCFSIARKSLEKLFLSARCFYLISLKFPNVHLRKRESAGGTRERGKEKTIGGEKKRGEERVGEGERGWGWGWGKGRRGCQPAKHCDNGDASLYFRSGYKFLN